MYRVVQNLFSDFFQISHSHQQIPSDSNWARESYYIYAQMLLCLFSANGDDISCVDQDLVVRRSRSHLSKYIYNDFFNIFI